MNKNKNTKKKKKGFTLMELIIVLAIMAIIAAIAIPNFTSIRENAKVKADKQSVNVIKRNIMMLVADDTIKPGTASKVISFSSGSDTSFTFTGFPTDLTTTTEDDEIKKAVKEVKAAQSTTSDYTITISTTGDVSVAVGSSINAD